MNAICKVQYGTMLFGVIDKAQVHPQYPNSTPKRSVTLIFGKESEAHQIATTAAMEVLSEYADKNFDKLMSAPDGKPMPRTSLNLKQAVMNAMAAKRLELGFPYKVVVARPDGKYPEQVGMVTIKGSRPEEPTKPSPIGLYILDSDRKYIQCPADQINTWFYPGGIYHAVFEFFISKVGTLCSRINKLYWAESGTRRSGIDYADASDFDAPTSTCSEGNDFAAKEATEPTA